jgi:hypothetical protein
VGADDPGPGFRLVWITDEGDQREAGERDKNFLFIVCYKPFCIFIADMSFCR